MKDKANTCIIVGGGDFNAALLPSRTAQDLLIAADSGYAHLLTAGIVPDICIGDFDSLAAPPDNCPVIRLPVEKDDTDTIAAARVGLERGFTHFIFLGVLGGRRISHSLAAVQTLVWLCSLGARGEILSDNCRIYTASCETVSFPPGKTDSISVFAANGPAELSISGLKYPLSRYTLTGSFPLGVSNSLIGRAAEITVHKGTVIIVEEPD